MRFFEKYFYKFIFVSVTAFAISLFFPSKVDAVCEGYIKCLYNELNACLPSEYGYYTTGTCGMVAGACTMSSNDCGKSYCIISDTCKLTGNCPGTCRSSYCESGEENAGTDGCGGGQVCCVNPPTPPPPPPPPPTLTPTPTPTPEPPPPPPAASCTATFSGPYNISVGTNLLVALTVVPQNGTVGSVAFSSSNTSVATINPSSDSISPYQTTISGLSVGESTIGANVYMGGSLKCTATTKVYVNSMAWWQVVDSDVIGGSIGSSVPLLYYFDDAGPGGFPGVPVYADSTTLNNDNVSSKGWLANASYNSNKVFNSNYYINLIPSEVSESSSSVITSNSVSVANLLSSGVSYNGYRWIIYNGASTGNLTITNSAGTSLGASKIILIVKNASINITGNINGMTRGSGFFLAVTEGDINVDPAVGGGASANLEGIYIANGTFNSGTTGTDADTQLWVRGSVAGYSGIDLYRDLGSANNTTPGEKFEYAPDQELLFPIALSYKLINWREIAP